MLKNHFFKYYYTPAVMLPLYVGTKCSNLTTLCHLEFLDLLNGNESITGRHLVLAPVDYHPD